MSSTAGVWLECDVAGCDAETLAQRADEFGWVVGDSETLCRTHTYLSAAAKRVRDVRSLAAGEGRDVDAVD